MTDFLVPDRSILSDDANKHTLYPIGQRRIGDRRQRGKMEDAPRKIMLEPKRRVVVPPGK